MAAAIVAVLSACDVSSADEALDDLGFPVLSPVAGVTAAPATVASALLGGGEDELSVELVAGRSESLSNANANTGYGSSTFVATRETNAVASIDRWDEAPAPSERTYSSRPRPVTEPWRSPLESTFARMRVAMGEDDGEDQRRREEIDARGIEAVCQYERDAGREPRVLSHGHPGWDIVSKDKDGEPRHIEVKSTDYEWPGNGVVLSRRQFEAGMDPTVNFWLYVVERARSGQPRIHAIRNPVARANRFHFDRGWSGAAE